MLTDIDSDSVIKTDDYFEFSSKTNFNILFISFFIFFLINAAYPHPFKRIPPFCYPPPFYGNFPHPT